ncbi:AraC family transcriptional regulator [Solimonas variicoloris]|uniref:AraC family transcriptional regulator n=1 Tax=Solimonas variicoloris TaxID=254408 RepID=UPI000374CA4A|nr:GyrI-like domain-containing protein [Solimonas variicoloris]
MNAAANSAARARYLERLQRPLALIEQAIAAGREPPPLAELARAAHFSPFHFHRLYRALCGEALGATVARLRMLAALQALRDPRVRVTDVALGAGYDTAQAFARAFRQQLGRTPSELRADTAALDAAIARLGAMPVATPQPALRVEVISVAPLRLLARHNVGDARDLDRIYTALFASAGELGLLDTLLDIYGRPAQDARDVAPADYAFDCALAFSKPLPASLPAGLSVLELGGGTYARLRHVGDYDGLDAAVEALLRDWLPDSGYVLRDTPLFHHYLDDPEQVAIEALRADVYVPVERDGADESAARPPGPSA